MKFAIVLDKTASPEAFQAAVPDHIAYMDELHRRGVLIAAGPFQDGKGGMVLVDVEDKAAAHAIAEADPFIARGVERYTLRQWMVLTPVRTDLLTRDAE